MRLYRVWMEDYEVNENRHSRNCRTFGKLRVLWGIDASALGGAVPNSTTAAPLGMARVMETVMFAQESQKRRRRKRRKPMINLHELHFSSKWSFFHIYIWVMIVGLFRFVPHLVWQYAWPITWYPNLRQSSRWTQISWRSVSGSSNSPPQGVSWAKLYFRDWLNNEICMQHDSPNFL